MRCHITVDDACGVNLRKCAGKLSTVPDDQVRWDKLSCVSSTLNALCERSTTEILENEILDRTIRSVIIERDDMGVVLHATEQIGFASRSVWVKH